MPRHDAPGGQELTDDFGTFCPECKAKAIEEQETARQAKILEEATMPADPQEPLKLASNFLDKIKELEKVIETMVEDSGDQWSIVLNMAKYNADFIADVPIEFIIPILNRLLEQYKMGYHEALRTAAQNVATV